jgi:hypothetical protein
MHFKSFVLTILAGLAAAPSLKADGSNQGVTAVNSFKLLEGARPAGMGGAFVAVADDANSMYYNPAGLSDLHDTQLTGSHLEWLDGVKQDQAALAMPIYGTGAWGLAADYLYAQDQGRDAMGNPTGTFKDFNFSARASMAVQLGDNASAGGTYKIYQDGYGHSVSMGSAFDFGLKAAFAQRHVTLGLGAMNLGTWSAIGSTSYPLPYLVQGGLAWKPLNAWTLAASYSYEPSEYLSTWRLGTEWNLPVSDSISAAFRGGYIIDPANADGSLSGVTGGLGVSWSGLQLDYAVAPQGDLGISYRVSLTYNFGEL